MKTLITPGQVVALAFDPSEHFTAEAIGAAVILSAERKFLAPALGPLYAELQKGRYQDLLVEYLRAPLALYVKWLVMPALAVQSGPMGVVRHHTANFSPADAKALAAARRRVKADAGALLQCAAEHIAANPALYPEYAPAEGPAVRGGIVL